MSVEQTIVALVEFGLLHDWFEESDRDFMINRVLEVLQIQAFRHPTDYEMEEILASVEKMSHSAEILEALTQDAVKRGIIEDTLARRDLFDTKLISVLLPRPGEVNAKFWEDYLCDPHLASDHFYQFNQQSNYIRTTRIAKDRKWKFKSCYGDLEVTINLSKPEKDPRDISALKDQPQESTDVYPQCLLCMTNEGYAGNLKHPARQNLRLIRLNLGDEAWFLQYSPYIYYNEHAIVLCGEHRPMVINEKTFVRLFDFLSEFPHYFIGSNADLPIVGGSILNHDHFQGGRHSFLIEHARETPLSGIGIWQSVQVSHLHWPLTTLRLRGENIDELVKASTHVLSVWREFSSPSCDVLAYTEQTPHNTITPIARYRNNMYEIDLVLRNNRTTQEHPLGLFHPHAEHHHIKKENIGLIEVMGLAILPGRLLTEIQEIKKAIFSANVDQALSASTISHHKNWVKGILANKDITPENVDQELENAIGETFARVLEDCGVFKHDEKGQSGLRDFLAKL